MNELGLTKQLNNDYVVFGGTFDPVHLGHLNSAQELAQVMGYQRLILMPCGDAYHKGGNTSSAKHRLAMLNLAVQEINKSPAGTILQVDDRETRRQGATYTVDTLQALRDELGPDAHLVWVMGTDAAQGLHQWHDWQRMFELANIIVVARNGEVFHPTHVWPASHVEDIKQFKGQSHGVYHTVCLTPVDISSSDIRLALQSSKSVENHVPQTILNYVEQHGLYQGNN